jgi:tRNA(Ile)-lysidine synthase
MQNEGFDKLAVAHHKDDQIETILFNLAKGTGISGLTGMQPRKSDNTIRPLLFTDRKAIEDYARTERLSWREDSSNDSLKYHRNFIRRKVIPVLKEVNPGLLDTLDYTLLRLTETESILNKTLLSFLKEAVRKDGDDLYILKSSLQSSTFPTLALHAVASPFGFNYQQCVNVIESLEKAGNLFYSASSVINIDRLEIILSPVEQDDFHSHVFEVNDTHEPVPLDRGRLKVMGILPGDAKIDRSSNIAFLDYDKLKFPLKVRHWASGDWFIPLGMNGKKKVSDLMIDEKIPLNLKSRVLVMESNGDIIWVVGHRIDDRYKVTDNTTKVWRADYEEN